MPADHKDSPDTPATPDFSAGPDLSDKSDTGHTGPSVLLPVDPALCGADLRITHDHWDALTEHLLSDGHEQSALLICGVRDTRDRRSRDTACREVTFLVQELVLLGEADYLDRGALHLSVAPATLARHAKRARFRDAAVVLVHSHPFSGTVSASSIDLATELDLCRRVIPSRTGRPAGALVVGPGGVDARAWTNTGAAPLHTIHIIGDRITKLTTNSAGLPSTRGASRETETATVAGTETQRQELLWGKAGQQMLADSHVVVVGNGGTGSHAVTQLAQLRVGHLTLIDGDVVEATNLSRLVGAVPSDVGRWKVDVLAECARAVNPSIELTVVRGSVLDVDPAVYTGADVIVCATDGHGSRSLLTELCTQYLVPLVDLGVEVDPGTRMDLGNPDEPAGSARPEGAGDTDQFRAGGGVRVLRPGQGCLWCAGTLNPEFVRQEYLDPEQRALDVARGYIRGVDVPEPSVIALNGVVSSLAVLEVCQLLVGMLGSGTARVLYRAERRSVRTARIARRSSCHVCGDDGVFAQGDAVSLKTRWRDNADDLRVQRLG